MTVTKQIRLCAVQALQRQIQQRKNHTTQSKPWFLQTAKIALVTATVVAVGTAAYFAFFWAALKLGIQI